MKKKYLYSISFLCCVTVLGIGFVSFTRGFDALLFWQQPEPIVLPLATEQTVDPQPDNTAEEPLATSPTYTALPDDDESNKEPAADPVYASLLVGYAEGKLRENDIVAAQKLLRKAVELNAGNAKAQKYLQIIEAGETPEAPPLLPEIALPPPTQNDEKHPPLKNTKPTPKAKASLAPKVNNSPAPTITPTPPAEAPSEDEQYAKMLAERAAVLLKSNQLPEAQKLFAKVQDLDSSGKMFAYGVDQAKSALEKSADFDPEYWEQLVLALQNSTTEIPNLSQSIAEDATCKFAIDTGTYPKDFYANVTLGKPLPKQFLAGEISLITGVIQKKPLPKKAMVFFSPKSDPSNLQSFVGDVQDGVFRIPVLFSEAGSYSLSVYPGTSGSAKVAEITVVRPECEPTFGVETNAPSNLHSEINDGMPSIVWEKNDNDLFRIVFEQKELRKEYYVFGESKMMMPLSDFLDFTVGEFTISLWGASAGANALDRQTDWAFGGKETFVAAEHISRRDNNLTDVHLAEEFVPGEIVGIFGTSDESLASEMVLIAPDEQIINVPLQVDGKDFAASFVAEQAGTYLVEINRKDMLSLFVGGTVSKGSLPIIPDYFDLRLSDQLTEAELDNAKLSEEMLRYINRERATRKLNLFKIDSRVANLAKARADDMCERKYFGHVTPDGKTAGDLMETYNIDVSIGENLAESSSIQSAHESLMRSPVHRELIISPDFDTVGFGFCWERKTAGQLTIVQIFGGKE